MRLISPFLVAVAWWQMRRVRRATHDLRRANYYATRSLRTLIAVGRGPIPRTASGVPAMPPMPVCAMMIRLASPGPRASPDRSV